MDQEQDEFQDVIGFGPRVSSLYRVTMFEGWLVGEESYASSMTELWEILEEEYRMPIPAKVDEQEKYNELYRKGFVYWTDWYSIDLIDWWIPPTPHRILQAIQAWSDTHIEDVLQDDLQDTQQVNNHHELTGYLTELATLIPKS